MGLCKDCIHTNVCIKDKNIVGDVFLPGNPMLFDYKKQYEEFKERERAGFPCEDFLSIDILKEGARYQRMKIYPISESLEQLMESFIDPETGEITATEEEMQSAIEQMQIDFDDKIVELRNDYINLSAEAKILKEEEERISKRRKAAEGAAERRKRWIAYLLKGETFQKDAVKISYRASEEVKYTDDDQEKFVLWADKNFPSLLSYKQPTPNKTEIKKAIKAGMKVDYAYIAPKKNVQIK